VDLTNAPLVQTLLDDLGNFDQLVFAAANP
jgi:hypothetical protein